MLIAFHKPFGVLSQFTSDLPRRSEAKTGPQAAGSENRTLAEFGFPKNVYPIGRLDVDSEGLLLLGDEPEWNERLLHPRHAHEREYWAQVERIPTRESLKRLEKGLIIQGRKTLPCRAWVLEPQPEISRVAADVGRLHLPSSQSGLTSAATIVRLPPRDPPIRYRKTVPTCWIGLELVEGKNRQVRRMTAAIGHPTLRLIRVRISGLKLGTLGAGEWTMVSTEERRLLAAR